MENSADSKFSLKNKKVWVPLVIILVIVFTLLGFNTDRQTNKIEEPQKSVILEVKNLPSTEIVSNIPDGIFTEQNTEITNSYSALSVANTLQSTLQYVSEKSLKDNVTFFEAYTKKNGWVQTGVSTTTKDAFYFYQKGESRLSISVSYDQVRLKNLVDITVEVPNK